MMSPVHQPAGGGRVIWEGGKCGGCKRRRARGEGALGNGRLV